MPSFTVALTDHRFKSVEQERQLIQEAGGQLVVGQCRTEDDVIAFCQEADGLLVVGAPITATVLAALPKCRVVVRYGIGVDTIDLEAASRRGIMVANVPDYCLDEVSDHALALLLAVARRLPAAIELGRAPRWEMSRMPTVRRLRGQTLGLIGMGRIGSRLAAKVRPLGIDVIAFDPYLSEQAAAEAGVARVPFEHLLERADIISVHAPLTTETRHIVNADAFARMKPTAILINTARGGLIDQAALREAIISGRIAGAGLDVLEEEPPRQDDPLLTHPNVIVTAHVAWYSEEAGLDLQRKAAEQVIQALRGQEPAGLINRAALRSVEAAHDDAPRQRGPR